MPLTSMMTPVVVERPAKQWPPLRSASGSPSLLANAIACATSPDVPHRTITRGRTPSKRAIWDLRADSYPAEPATSTSPPTVMPAWTDSDMQGGPVDEFLDVTVERPALDQLEVEVGRTLENRGKPGLTSDHREERHLNAVDQTGGHQRPVHRQAAVRAQRHVGLLLQPRDDVDGVTARDGRVGPVERLLQRRGDDGRRHLPHRGDPWVAHLGVLGARAQHLCEQPVRLGPEDHPLLRAEQLEAMVEQLGALLAPVARPARAHGAEAV